MFPLLPKNVSYLVKKLAGTTLIVLMEVYVARINHNSKTQENDRLDIPFHVL
jgi:hypothetical protein